MKNQILFNRVSKHLITQRTRSTMRDPESGSFHCAYHNGKGNSCAVGCLLPKKVDTSVYEGSAVDPNHFTFEGYSRQSSTGQLALVHLMADLYDAGVEDDNLPLLKSLQLFHDSTQGRTFASKAGKAELREIAHKFYLEIPPWLS
jgi:hypothetical protein